MKTRLGRLWFFPITKMLSLKVTGLIDKVPANSHFHFDIFGSMTGLDEAKSDSWMGSNFFTYVLLKPGYDYKKLEAKLPGMVKKYMGPQIQQAMGMSLEQFRTKGNDLGFALQPLTSIHLYSHSNFELTSARRCHVCLHFRSYCHFYVVDSLYQFHQPVNSKRIQTCERSRCA